MNYVVCLKHGTKYSAEYVNVLYNMVQRNLTIPYEFVCFTEDRKGLDPNIKIIDLFLHPRISGWWYKTYFFNPNIGLKGTLLYFDLDVIIFDNIDKLFDYKPGEFCIIRDFNRSLRPDWNRMNSSIFRLEVGQHRHVYENYIKDPTKARFHGDQDWIYNQIQTDFEFWPDEWIQSYKWEMRDRNELVRINGVRNFRTPGVPKIADGCSVAVFHGQPNPHDCIDPWCKEHWK